MNRRRFLLSSALAAPFSARAQSLPLVGWMHGGSAAPNGHLIAAFRAGLAEAGYVEGRNVRFDWRWANGRYDLLREMAEDFVRQRAAVIAALGNVNAARAAMTATQTIPIVFANAADPVETGLVTRMNRPTANATGVTYLQSFMGPKRLEILSEIIPAPGVIGVLLNPENVISANERPSLLEAARKLGRAIRFYEASNSPAIEAVFQAAAADGAAAMLVNIDVYFTSLRNEIAAIAIRHRKIGRAHV